MAQRRNNDVLYFVYLMLQLYQQYQQLPYKPPCTIGITLVLIAIFLLLQQRPLLLFSFAMNPYEIIMSHSTKSLVRIITSPFMHIENYHLYYNVSSLLWKGSFLEVAMGSKSFIVMTLFLIIVSGVLFTLLSSFVQFFYSSPFYSNTIGFSSVLFGYKVISHYFHVVPMRVAGIRMPSSSITWFELIYCSLLPNVSFLGHLCGILAGYAYILLPRFVHFLRGNATWFTTFENRRREEEPSYHRSMPTEEELNEELRVCIWIYNQSREEGVFILFV